MHTAPGLVKGMTKEKRDARLGRASSFYAGLPLPWEYTFALDSGFCWNDGRGMNGAGGEMAERRP